MLSSIRKMYEIYYFMKKITLIIMEGAQFDQSNIDGLMRNYLCIYISSGKLGDDSKKRIIIIVSGNNKNSFQSTITTRITRYSIGIVTKIIKHDI